VGVSKDVLRGPKPPSCFETAPAAAPQHEGFVLCKLLRQAITFASVPMISGRMFVILDRLDPAATTGLITLRETEEVL
jgi:hypothetical protein